MLEILKTYYKLLSRRGVHDSYAQDGEDMLVQSLLRKRDGFYVDVGAYHPVLYSNTYSFYKRGWKGLVIDPNVSMRSLYKVFRPHDTFIANGIGSTSETKTYYMFSDGAYNTFSETDAEELKKHSYPEFLGTQELACRPLADIVHEQNLSHIDFMSVDVEGLDLMVLESHDWSVRPRVIAVEDNDFKMESASTNALYQFLTGKGYKLAAFAPRTLIFEDTKGEL